MDDLIPDFPVVYIMKPRLAAQYRKDVDSQQKFERFLNNNISRLHDAYWNRQWVTVH